VTPTIRTHTLTHMLQRDQIWFRNGIDPVRFAVQIMAVHHFGTQTFVTFYSNKDKDAYVQTVAKFRQTYPYINLEIPA